MSAGDYQIVELDVAWVTSTRCVAMVLDLGDEEREWMLPQGQAYMLAGFLTFDDKTMTSEMAYVVPEARRKGVARRLWDAAERVVGGTLAPHGMHSPFGEQFARSRGHDIADLQPISLAEAESMAQRFLNSIGSSLGYVPADLVKQVVVQKVSSSERREAATRVQEIPDVPWYATASDAEIDIDSGWTGTSSGNSEAGNALIRALQRRQQQAYGSLKVEAAWSDVQQKAARIRQNGGVRILSAPDAKTGNQNFVVADVNGDTNVYRTQLMLVPGSASVALWECGCAWAAYSWGRSGRWKKYEGRMCAHALAVLYEAQSRGGKDLRGFGEDPGKPDWHAEPHQYEKPPIPLDRGFVGSRTAMADRSGDPFIDAMIEEFLRQPGTQELVDPQVSHGDCVEISEAFKAFVEPRLPGDYRVYLTHTDLDEMGYEIQSGSAGGEVLDGDGEIVVGHYDEHAVVSIYTPDSRWPFLIDFTASQYGYTDLPKVTSSTGASHALLQDDEDGARVRRVGDRQHGAVRVGHRDGPPRHASADMRRGWAVESMSLRPGFPAVVEGEPVEVVGIEGETVTLADGRVTTAPVEHPHPDFRPGQMRVASRTASREVLYHYTSGWAIESIWQQGLLRLTESNLSAGADRTQKVVWLTEDDNPNKQEWAGGIGGGPMFKTQYRITVDPSRVRGLHRWAEWSRTNGIEEWWYDALDKSGGGGAEQWWVATEEVPSDAFLKVEFWDGSDWELMWDPHGGGPTASKVAYFDDARTVQERLSRCYELAGRRCFEEPGWELVHGSIQGMGNPRIGHAWCITADGQHWDPIMDSYLPDDEHRAFYNAEVYGRWSQREAMQEAVRTGHYGPWAGPFQHTDYLASRRVALSSAEREVDYIAEELYEQGSSPEEFVLEHDGGSLCYDVSAAIAARFGYRQVYGTYLANDGTRHPHSWNATDDGGIIDGTWSQFHRHADDAIYAFNPGSAEHQRYTEDDSAFFGRRTTATADTRMAEYEQALRRVRNIYRGFGVSVTPEEHEALFNDDAWKPRLAQFVLDKVSQRGLGRHWTANRNEAAGFAGMAANKGMIRVILRADAPDLDDVEFVEGHGIGRWHDQYGEQEIPVRPGATLDITRVEWAPGGPRPMFRDDDGGGWVSLHLGQSQQRTASLSVEAGSKAEDKVVWEPDPSTIYYHGTDTTAADLIRERGFSLPKFLTGRGADYGNGVYITRDRSMARYYARGSMVRVRLTPGTRLLDLAYAQEVGLIDRYWESLSGEQMQQAAEAAGCHGVVVAGRDFVEEPIAIYDPARVQYIDHTIASLSVEAVDVEPDDCMVALRPPDDVLEALVETGMVTEPFEDLHITMAFVKGADPEVLHEAVVAFAKQAPPLVGRIGGYGAFINDDSHVLWASPNIPTIETWRERLVDVLALHGLHPEQTHGFTPHLTMAYCEQPPAIPEVVPEGEFTMDHVIVACGGNQWTEVALEGGMQKVAVYGDDDAANDTDIPCPQCNGNGALETGATCPNCSGTGRVQDTSPRKPDTVAMLDDEPEPALPTTDGGDGQDGHDSNQGVEDDEFLFL